MKLGILGTLPLLFVTGSQVLAQSEIKVDLKDLQGNTVVVQVVNTTFSGIEKADTLPVKKGKFTYTLSDPKARMAIANVEGPEGKKSITFYMVPGEKGTLQGTVKQPVWGGSAFYQELGELEAVTQPLQQQMDSLADEYRKQTAAGANADSLQKILNPLYEDLNSRQKAACKNFIQAHPASEAGITVLPGTEDPEKTMQTLQAAIAKDRFTYFIDFTRKKLDYEKKQKEASKDVADGKLAPDFTLKSIDGTDLSLSSLRGKYVILDFWGSWCGWCIKGFPEMKKYYQKYSDRLEILGVDCNDTEEKWKAAVEKHELKWKHVFNPQDSDLPARYAVSGYPTKIIIDPDGKIVKTVAGEDPAFYNFLDELFK